jgi:hypothetical protein
MSEPLKLIALDPEDLSIVSAHLQDAVLLVGDMVYQPRERRFVAIANRFDWGPSRQCIRPPPFSGPDRADQGGQAARH